jgi:hypothetical protein
MAGSLSRSRLVEAGMDVRDVDGIKLGTVTQVIASPTGKGELAEVKTGSWGRNRILYIPTNLVQAVVEGSAFLWQTRRAVERAN